MAETEDTPRANCANGLGTQPIRRGSSAVRIQPRAQVLHASRCPARVGGARGPTIHRVFARGWPNSPIHSRCPGFMETGRGLAVRRSHSGLRSQAAPRAEGQFRSTAAKTSCSPPAAPCTGHWLSRRNRADDRYAQAGKRTAHHCTVQVCAWRPIQHLRSAVCCSERPPETAAAAGCSYFSWCTRAYRLGCDLSLDWYPLHQLRSQQPGNRRDGLSCMVCVSRGGSTA